MTMFDIVVGLLARPHALTLAERDDFEIGVTATNRGSITVDPGLDRVRLFINGEDNLPFADAIGNGIRDGSWYALPPGGTISRTWPGIGRILFPDPGEYRLELVSDDGRTEPQIVRVQA